MKNNNWVDRNITLYYTTEFLNNLMFLIPVYIAFQNNYLTLTQMGFLASARYIMMFVMELPTGVLADLFGRKLSCTIGAVVDALGLLIIAFFPSSFWIIVGTLIRAVGESAISGANTALIYDTLKEGGREDEYTTIAAKENMLVQTALISATFIGGFLYSISPTLPFLINGIAIMISGFFYLTMKEPYIDSIKYSWSGYVTNTKNGLKELTKNSYIKYLSVYFMLVAGITWSWNTYINLVYLNGLGFPESKQGIILSSIRLINAFLIVAVAVSILKFTKSKGAWIHPILIGFGSVLALIPNQMINVLAIVPLMFASNLRFNLLNKLANEVFDSRHRATALSALNLLMGIVYATIVGLSGPLIEVTHPRWIYFYTGILPLPILAYLTIKMKKHYLLKTVEDLRKKE